MKIGTMLPLNESPDLGRPPTFQEIRALALQAEGAGFDSIWLYDHLLYRFPEGVLHNFPDGLTLGIWECWSILAALAEATERVDLGTLVVSGLWRNPALLAKMAVTVDEISNGRFILGLGPGAHRPDFDAFGYPFDHRVSRFEEAIEIVASLLREGKVDFHGRYFNAPDCELRPRGPRPGGPPVLIASQGPRMLKLTAQFADAWNTAWFGLVDGITDRRAELERACAEIGRDPKTIAVTVGVNVFYPMPGMTPTREVDPDRTLMGTPEEIAAGLRAYEDAGVSHVICGAPGQSTYEYGSYVITQLSEALKVYRSR
jgi:probable F420-dependent oxidoreductase